MSEAFREARKKADAVRGILREKREREEREKTERARLSSIFQAGLESFKTAFSQLFGDIDLDEQHFTYRQAIPHDVIQMGIMDGDGRWDRTLYEFTIEASADGYSYWRRHPSRSTRLSLEEVMDDAADALHKYVGDKA